MFLMSRNLLFFLLAFVFAASCSRDSDPEQIAERFLASYLDCDFSRATKLATEDMRDAITWRASNLTQADLDVLNAREMPVEVEVDDVESFADSCVVTLKASNALLADSIGSTARVGDACFRMILRKEKGSNWKVATLVPIS